MFVARFEWLGKGVISVMIVQHRQVFTAVDGGDGETTGLVGGHFPVI